MTVCRHLAAATDVFDCYYKGKKQECKDKNETIYETLYETTMYKTHKNIS